ncbi:unnamed protein product [Rotaria sp. Silwood2]|nr:unnamed protein product [Rotaria sp. Silwood2]CAF2936888.1 unnamed protein product [Rotaria sp. Silwood2]CAF3061253.1 unnamed protein product [Rotaria sp. Silwood2]CAF3314169.1 unnamed protein product [Rotaria sp. Silwood2]CAF3908108.1 unnamed protein product [Rotaria sp. Silwood2]
MSQPALDIPSNHDPEKPNHMIFWLDASIGSSAEYLHLKKAFASNTDPRYETWTMLTDRDYDNLLVATEAQEVKFKGVRFLLQAFTKVEDCLEAFEKNQDKRIFFITSGQLGRHIVPKIIQQYRHIFTDLITDQPYSSIYVFCHDFEGNANWAIEYIEYIQIFDFDADLLERMTLDISKYFIERGKRLRQDNNLEGALQRLRWAKKLCHQHDKIEQQISTDNPRSVQESQTMKNINGLIEEIEKILPKESSLRNRSSSDNDDNEEEYVRSSEPSS